MSTRLSGRCLCGPAWEGGAIEIAAEMGVARHKRGEVEEGGLTHVEGMLALIKRHCMELPSSGLVRRLWNTYRIRIAKLITSFPRLAVAVTVYSNAAATGAESPAPKIRDFLAQGAREGAREPVLGTRVHSTRARRHSRVLGPEAGGGLLCRAQSIVHSLPNHHVIASLATHERQTQRPGSWILPSRPAVKIAQSRQTFPFPSCSLLPSACDLFPQPPGWYMGGGGRDKQGTIHSLIV
jgi:hypothetical protein